MSDITGKIYNNISLSPDINNNSNVLPNVLPAININSSIVSNNSITTNINNNSNINLDILGYSSGVINFIKLKDVPNSYLEYANSFLLVNDDENGIKFAHTIPISYIDNLQTSLNLKVDKVEGKGLSDENYSLIEKLKLEGIQDNANNYILPEDVVQDSLYVHTDNNFTDELKLNYDDTVIKSHTHNNKTALDNVSGINTGDETNESIKIKLGTDLSDKLDYNGNGSNLTGLTKSQIGLGNVDNTSDANKPISTAQQVALNDKANKNGSLSEDFSINNALMNTLNGHSVSDIVQGLKEVSFIGAIDGENDTFITANAYNPLYVYINGIFYNENFYTYSDLTLTFNTAPDIGFDLKLYANEGIFGLNEPILLNDSYESALINSLTGSSNTNYTLPTNTIGNALDIINYSTTVPLKIACLADRYGGINSKLSQTASAGVNVIYVANPEIFEVGQNILIFNKDTFSNPEINTIVSVESDSLVLKNNLVLAHDTNQYAYVATIFEIPINTGDGSNNPPQINSIKSFSNIQVIASGNFMINILGISM